MVENIEQKVIDLATRHDGVYLFKKSKKDTITPESSIHFDLRLDIDEAQDLMDEFFTEFSVSRGLFTIETYYPEVQLSLNPFKKQVLDVPDFTIGMLIESAKAGKWLY